MDYLLIKTVHVGAATISIIGFSWRGLLMLRSSPLLQQKWLARDAAVHCLYSVSHAAFAQLRQDLWQLKLKYEQSGIDTARMPLGVHPASLDARTGGAFAADVRKVILRYAGTGNLRRATFTALRVPDRWWRFGALERDGQGGWQRVEIPRLETQAVDIFNVAVEDGVDLGPERGLDAIFNVLPEEYPEEDNLFTVINKGYRFNDDRDLPVFRNKLSALARFSNPQRTSAADLDCASCHYADAARFYVRNRFPELDDVLPADAFRNPDPDLFDLSNTTLAVRSARVVRAFGFHGDQPVVSQRTINESAAVADRFNREMLAAAR